MTVAEIIARHRRYGRSRPVGEWGHIQDAPRAEFLTLLEAGDEDQVAAYLARMFRTNAMAGLVTLDWRFTQDEGSRAHLDQDMQVSLLLWLHLSPTGDGDVRTLSAPACGKPYTFDVQGMPVLTDTPRHDYYARNVRELVPGGGLVVEIGAGYGGFACQLLRGQPGYRIMLVDLPETLYLAAWWLSHALPDRRIAWYDADPTADIVLVPAQEVLRVTARPDLVFASHSLSEMAPEVALGYVRWIELLGVRWFYHDNAEIAGPTTALVAGGGREGTTSAAFPEVLNRDLAPGTAYREHVCRSVHWPSTGGRYRERLYERIA